MMYRLLIACMMALVSLQIQAEAKEPKEADTLDQLLQQVKASQGEQGRRDRQREQQFINANNQQQALLDAALKKLEKTKLESERLKQQFDDNEAKLVELGEELHQATGTLGELFGVVRQASGDLKGVLENSLISAQFPERTQPLDELASSKALPTVDELEQLWFALLQEMTESGKSVKFESAVLSPEGVKKQQEVVRIGPFTAVADGKYLNYLAETQQLMEFPRQPGNPHPALAQSFSQASTGTVQMTIDPARGSVLGLLGQVPNKLERVQQGGVIGYIILGIGLVGVLLALERIIHLSLIGSRMQKQLKNTDQLSNKNPLGRVLAVFKQNRAEKPETLEARLDEAILREAPALTRGVRLLKLMAAAAPLLGLLGTVTGMIGTFQAISLFGTGDPKLMAGGISQALVTTMLGLIVAIPLLFMHANVLSRSQRCIQILDEQSAGLIAKKMG